jgi:hypothetical protein
LILASGKGTGIILLPLASNPRPESLFLPVFITKQPVVLMQQAPQAIIYVAIDPMPMD